MGDIQGLDCFFPLELREAKLIEFMNLKQGNMSVREYYLKFTKMSKYAPFLVTDSRTRMNKFISRLFDSIFMECTSVLLVKEMDISRLMTYAELVESEKLRREKKSELKRARHEGGFSNAKSGGGGRFQQGQGSSHCAQRFAKERVHAPKAQGGGSNVGGTTYPTCSKCGRSHVGDCLRGMNACFGCGKWGIRFLSVQMLMVKKRCPQSQVAQRGQVQQGVQTYQGGGPRNNRFYALHLVKKCTTSRWSRGVFWIQFPSLFGIGYLMSI